jgi:hypothetical protein
MSEEFFARPSAPPSSFGPPPPGAAVGWRPAAVPNSVSAEPSTVTVSTRVLIGIGACVAGAFACLGACAPWFSLSVEGVTASFSGLHSHLDGDYLLVLGVIAMACGVALAVLPAHTPGRVPVATVLALVGVVGLVIAARQYVHLSDTASRISDLGGLIPGDVLNLHAAAGWGLWLDGLACTAMVLLAALAVVL